MMLLCVSMLMVFLRTVAKNSKQLLNMYYFALFTKLAFCQISPLFVSFERTNLVNSISHTTLALKTI